MPRATAPGYQQQLGRTTMEPQKVQNDTPQPLADDILTGANEIGKFLFGDDTNANRRRIYYLTERTRLPVFRLGSVLCARRSVLLNWIAGQENRTSNAIEEKRSA
jgi:hypothetical protein